MVSRMKTTWSNRGSHTRNIGRAGVPTQQYSGRAGVPTRDISGRAGAPTREYGGRAEALASRDDSYFTSSEFYLEANEIPRIDAPASALVNVIEYADGAPQRRRVLEVASPPRDASSITRLPGLSWKYFLRDLKDGGIEQVCLITDEAIDSTFAVSDGELPSRQPSAEPKSAREERFATQSWNALRESGNPVYDIAREYADVFLDKMPAELATDRGVQHEIDLVPGSKYCVTPSSECIYWASRPSPCAPITRHCGQR
ncbi:unnamed protein product [Peronospora destructor]|uniref:Uncharacterized protein n=1 Tax=Peronospora destructor TaxID=86335 RepID=A0AAV0TKZ0_9STRA|nr:unnamed protein product [Peronospora destructor]